MDSIRSFFDSFKEFIWDIIGYLLPGSYLLILLSICIDEKFFLIPTIGTKDYDFYPFIFIVISYLLGYVAYGVGCFKEKILGKRSYVKSIEEKISKRQAFEYSKELLSKGLKAKKITDKLNDATVRDVRNLVMGFIPESDHKIYTFTFRSDLANHTGNISVITGFLGIMFSIFHITPLFKSDVNHVILYIILIIAYIFLRETRNRFYHISVGLPFSIYTSKSIE